jgi:broad specificity phosphatase PhoE
MHQSTTNPDKKFGSIYAQRRYDEERTKDSNTKQRIFCLRHGQTALDDLHRSDGWLDLPLNDDGRKNVVVALAEHLKEVPITTIYSSPLKRTEETAHIVESGLPSKPKVKTSPKLKTWNLGSLAGDPKKPNKEVVKDLCKNPTKSAPDGESYNDFTERFDSYIKKLEKESKHSGPFLVVLSGSNCRRLSELLFKDRTVLDIDEAGLFCMHLGKDGEWTADLIEGGRSPEDIEKNPEAS